MEITEEYIELNGEGKTKSLNGARNELLLPLAGVLLGIAFLYPESVASAILGYASVIFFVVGAKVARRKYLGFFSLMFVASVIGFYWLPETMDRFGGFPIAVSYAIHFLYCVSASLQLVFCCWLYKRLRATIFESFFLALPLAWFVCELLFPRLFPWSFAHTQISWTSFASLAEFFGVAPLTILMFWWVEIVVYLVRADGRDQRWRLSLVALLASIGFAQMVGYLRTVSIEELVRSKPVVNVGIIQGNLSTNEKGNVAYLSANLDTYRTLSKKAVEAGAEFLVWPESVMNVWTPESVASLRNTRLDPYPAAKVPLVYGTLAYRLGESGSDSDVLKFNSGMAIDEKGEVMGRYHKRILMPFGEYFPLADTFPALAKMSPQTGDFTVGDIVEPFTFSFSGQGGARRSFKMALLICYEDLVPGLSAEFVRQGAEVLVNITNDAWYGDTAAPYQHHLLALWRSIETRRFMIRSTNTGYTAVVDPFGRSLSPLDTFTEDFAITKIVPLRVVTLFSRLGNYPAYSLALFVVVMAIWGRREVINREE